MPRIPKSTTSTPAGSSRRASRPASATPKPSSPRKTLPMPATSTRTAGAAGASAGSGSTSSIAKKKRWPGWRRSPRSRPGSSSTTTVRCSLPSVSSSMPSTAAVRPAEREIHHVAARARAQAHAAAPAQLDARDGDGVRRRPLELLPGAGHRSARKPERRRSCSCVRPSVRSRIARARASPRAHLGLLLVGQRHDREPQQPVDLAAVVQVARALGGDPRVVLEDDRRGEHRVVGAGLADEHRPQPFVAAAGRGLAQAVGRVGQRDEGARGRAQHDVRGAQRPGAPGHARRRPVDGLDGDPPHAVADRLGGDRQLARQRRERERAGADLALDRLLVLARRLQEPRAHLHAGGRGALEQALGPRPPARPDVAERERALVLQRRAPVRPQQVALVEHGVGDLADGVHQRSASSVSTVSSHVASALRALNDASRSTLSLLIRSQPVPRK